MPWSIRLLVASASLTGIDQSGAERKRVDVAQHLRDRFCRDEAELAALGGVAGDDSRNILGLVDIAEIAAGVLRILVAPQPAAMFEPQFRKLGRHLEDVGVVVAERGRKQ